jgi:flavin reductase (DIM6/NTAB) family NADH-FMN oxidoreductase RutF
MKEKISVSTDKRTWKPSPLAGQVVLVTSLNEDGQSNVAPKSWISMMAFEPALLALGCNLSHWTARNILHSREFVVNIPGAELAQVIWRCSALPHPRPVECTGLTPIPAEKVKPPRIADCKAHLECSYVQHLTFGCEVVFLGQILAVSMDQEVATAEDPYEAMRILAFLEDGKYGVIEKSWRIES